MRQCTGILGNKSDSSKGVAELSALWSKSFSGFPLVEDSPAPYNRMVRGGGNVNLRPTCDIICTDPIEQLPGRGRPGSLNIN